jgi:hypothetical protein
VFEFETEQWYLGNYLNAFIYLSPTGCKFPHAHYWRAEVTIPQWGDTRNGHGRGTEGNDGEEKRELLFVEKSVN